MNARQKSVVATAAYIAAILKLAHLGSKDVNTALTVLMLAMGSIIVGILVRAFYGLTECLVEEHHEGPRDW